MKNKYNLNTIYIDIQYMLPLHLLNIVLKVGVQSGIRTMKEQLLIGHRYSNTNIQQHCAELCSQPVVSLYISIDLVFITSYQTQQICCC